MILVTEKRVFFQAFLCIKILTVVKLYLNVQFVIYFKLNAIIVKQTNDKKYLYKTLQKQCILKLYSCTYYY